MDTTPLIRYRLAYFTYKVNVAPVLFFESVVRPRVLSTKPMGGSGKSFPRPVHTSGLFLLVFYGLAIFVQIPFCHDAQAG